MNSRPSSRRAGLGAWKTIALAVFLIAVALVLEHQPEGENGWEVFETEITPLLARIKLDPPRPALTASDAEAASRALVMGKPRGVDDLVDGEWGHPAHAPGLEVLAELRRQGFFDAVERAAGAPRLLDTTPVTMPLFSGISNRMGSRIGDWRRVARALASEARRLAHEGDLDSSVALLLQAQRIADGLAAEPLIIHRLLAISVSALVLTEAARIQAETPLGADRLAQLVGALPQRGALRPPLTVALEGERLILLDMIQHTYTDNGAGNGRLIMGAAGLFGGAGGVIQSPANLVGYFYPSRKVATKALNDWMDAVAASYTDLRDGRQVDLEAVALQGDTFAEMNPFLSGMIPASGRMVFNQALLDEMADAFRFLAAIEIHRERHGDVPASLEALIAAEPTLGAAPRNPWTMKPIWYEPLAEPDEHGRRFRLCWRDPNTPGGAAISERERVHFDWNGHDILPPRRPVDVAEPRDDDVEEE